MECYKLQDAFKNWFAIFGLSLGPLPKLRLIPVQSPRRITPLQSNVSTGLHENSCQAGSKLLAGQPLSRSGLNRVEHSVKS